MSHAMTATARGTAGTPDISGPGRTGRARPPVDLARVGVVVLFTLTAGANSGALWLRLTGDDLVWQKAAGVASSILALSFCALVVRAYLRRGAASATDRGPLVWLVAPLATVVPLGMAAIPPRSAHAPRTALELGLTLAGLGISVWALRSLAANLSIVPQARSAVMDGPYRWVRHPLYVGEFVALCGLALHVGRAPAALVVAGEAVLQVYRAGREERLLVQEVPGYREYAERTNRLIPGMW
jgi:protein-S-isoprenylcysteine O-methyltransferase Ste14